MACPEPPTRISPLGKQRRAGRLWLLAREAVPLAPCALSIVLVILVVLIGHVLPTGSPCGNGGATLR